MLGSAYYVYTATDYTDDPEAALRVVVLEVSEEADVVEGPDTEMLARRTCELSLLEPG